jgi:hypothetical protein
MCSTAVCFTGGVADSELVELVERCSDPFLPRSEIDEHGDLIFYTDDDTKTVSIMGHLIVQAEPLGRRSRGRRFEGTCGHVTTGSAAGWLHPLQYVPPEWKLATEIGKLAGRITAQARIQLPDLALNR